MKKDAKQYISLLIAILLLTTISSQVILGAERKSISQNTSFVNNSWEKTESQKEIGEKINKCKVKKYNYSKSLTEYTTIATMEYGGHYYKIYDIGEYTWQDAESYCESLGGHLATITTDMEQNFIESILPNMNVSSYYLGAYKNSNGDWLWNTGEIWEYTKWGINQPDNYEGNQSYLRIVYAPNYNWNWDWDDVNADTKEVITGFICEWDKKITEINSKQNELEQKALTLIKNTNGRENPLLEYNDPENLFCGYAMSLAAQSAVYVYGDEFSKNKLWVGGYERCLDALFAENNLTKILSDCEISKFVEVVNNTKELIDMAVTDKLSTMIKATDGVDLVNILKLSDSFIRAKLQYYDGCVAILCQIMDNTNNENLKEACRVVMNDRYTFVIEEIEKQMMECFVENGIVLLEQNSEILGEFLAQYIALGAGEIATIIACSAEALSYVKAVTVAKDIISEFTGLRKRVENYLDAICFNTIYFASVNSYNNSLKKINSKQYEEKDISNFISMFEFIVKVKQKQYDCMNNMFTPDKLQKIKVADNYIDQHIMSLNKITIDNYRKVELQKLTPIANLKPSMKKGMKSNIRVTGIAYKGKVTYKSTNKKVAKVNSSGKVTAKKVGNTKIIVKIKQYGEELEIEKEVKVYK